MKTFITAAALAVSALTAAAQEATPAPEIDNFISTRTRAEVTAELLSALARGVQLPRGEVTYAPEFQRTASTRSRAEVRAEVEAAIARGERFSHGEAQPDPVGIRRRPASGHSAAAGGDAISVR